MKKCPQCGTILEESKKKCYMCGAELQKTLFGDFGDTFDEQIGATVSNSQDNAFNSVGNVMSGANGTVSNSNANVTFSNSMNSAEQVQENVAPSLPAKYDNRTAIEKIFSTDARYRQDALNFNGSTQDDFSNNPQCFESTPMVPLPPTEPIDLNEKKKKPAINWGNNLKNSYTDGNDNNNNSEGKKFGLNTIFNILSVVVFFVVVIFFYFKVIAPKNEPSVESFGGLTYEISPEFILTSEGGGTRYYSYGHDCALKIAILPTVETNSFLDSYFEKVKVAHSSSQVSVTEMSINGNNWTEYKVFDLEQNAAAEHGYAEVLSYKYVAILHKGNFYDIVFANDDSDNKCSAMFDQFQKSLVLE